MLRRFALVGLRLILMFLKVSDTRVVLLPRSTEGGVYDVVVRTRKYKEKGTDK